MPKIIREKVFGVADALVSLCPQASWGLGSSGTYDDIRWQDQSIPLPTEEEINDEIQRLQTQWDSTSYGRVSRHRRSTRSNLSSRNRRLEGEYNGC